MTLKIRQSVTKSRMQCEIILILPYKYSIIIVCQKRTYPDQPENQPVIRSMTGFGRSECAENGISATVEVVSVNGRFLDLRTKLPRQINPYESELRKIAQKYLARGRVTISVNIDQPGSSAREMRVDMDLAGRYLQLARDMADRYDIDPDINSRTLLSLPDVVTWEENGTNVEELWALVSRALESAFESHGRMREKEGRAIESDLKMRLDLIAGTLDGIEKEIPKAVAANTERLRKKIEKLVEDKFDETRFAMEVAVYADRADVTEECVRLRSHIEQFARELGREDASGRTLTFLLQEMNREVNTIGSKINDAGISQLAVRVKEELEKMREQAENME